MNTTPIANAVAPLKQAQIDRAVGMVADRIEATRLKFEAAGWDLNVVAPHPHGRMSRREYKQAEAWLGFCNAITTWTQPSRRHGDPNIVKWSDAGVREKLRTVAEMAGASFDLYVTKLEGKVGEHSTATLTCGGGVWGYSVISVTTPAGIQHWKTQQIVNVSVLGTLFNQWPTRLMK